MASLKPKVIVTVNAVPYKSLQIDDHLFRRIESMEIVCVGDGSRVRNYFGETFAKQTRLWEARRVPHYEIESSFCHETNKIQVLTAELETDSQYFRYHTAATSKCPSSSNQRRIVAKAVLAVLEARRMCHLE